MDPARPSRRRGLGWLALLLTVVVAVVAFVLVKDDGLGSSASTTASPSPTATRLVVGRVATFSASRGTTTKTFDAQTNWQLRWSAPAGSGFAVELLAADGTSLGRIVSGGRRGAGTTFVSQSGTFKLRVISRGPWSAQVYSAPVTGSSK